jgi:hypothetical protein
MALVPTDRYVAPVLACDFTQKEVVMLLCPTPVSSRMLTVLDILEWYEIDGKTQLMCALKWIGLASPLLFEIPLSEGVPVTFKYPEPGFSGSGPKPYIEFVPYPFELPSRTWVCEFQITARMKSQFEFADRHRFSPLNDNAL